MQISDEKIKAALKKGKVINAPNTQKTQLKKDNTN